MLDNPGPFHKLIGAEQEINNHGRKLQHESREESQRHGVNPHIDGIADKTEPAVAARPKNSGNQRRIHSSAHDVVHIDEKHDFQITHSRLVEGGKMDHKGRYDEDDHTADDSGEHRQLQRLSGIFLGLLDLVGADSLTDVDAACAGDGKAEYRTEVTHNHNQGVGSHHVASHMAHDDGIHRKSHAPDHVISQGRQREPHKILQKNAALLKHQSELKLHILGKSGNHQAGNQLHCTGSGGCKSHSSDAHFRSAKKAENENGIQNDIQKQCRHVQKHTDPHALNTSQDGKVDLRDTPAQVTDTDDPKVLSSQADQLLILSKKPHHGLRYSRRRYRKENGKAQSKAKGDTLHFRDGPKVFLSPVLSAEHGGACTQTVKDHIEHVGVLNRQGRGGHGGLAHRVQHDDVCRAYGGTEKVLNDDWNGQGENCFVTFPPVLLSDSCTHDNSVILLLCYKMI